MGDINATKLSQPVDTSDSRSKGHLSPASVLCVSHASFIFVNSTLGVILNKPAAGVNIRSTLSVPADRQTESLLLLQISLTNDESMLTMSSQLEWSRVILLYCWRCRQRYRRHCLLVQTDGLVSQLP
jgi:hypothetical protein